MESQSLSSRAMSFDRVKAWKRAVFTESQSLSSRAMSFDNQDGSDFVITLPVSIPFEQGDVFRQLPLFVRKWKRVGLNPFRAGRCLSTDSLLLGGQYHTSLNPFRAGRCLSTESDYLMQLNYASQSLSSRAMSFDLQKLTLSVLKWSLNPFRAGRCLSTVAVCWRQESCGFSDPLPNFFGRLRSWLLI